MKRTILFGLLCGSVLLANPVFANDAAQLQCEAQAAAKKLNGAAKTSFVGKCVKDATGAAVSARRRPPTRSWPVWPRTALSRSA